MVMDSQVPTVQLQIEDLVRQRAGLDVTAIGHSAMARAIRLRGDACGAHQLQQYWNFISASDEELQELIEAVVVNETWFFREPGAFEALTSFVFNEWLPVHSVRVLRVLSIPCATGEEPYSIAMALLDAGLPPDRFRIDAMDISLRVLSHARHGVYSKNSFRGPDLSYRARHFRAQPNGYHVAASVRGQVCFVPGNVLTLESLLGGNPYDVIFCRNMLIYFDRPTQSKVISKLEKLLTPTGILFVGPAEAFLMRDSNFTPLKHSGAFGFRKSGAQEMPAPPADSRRRTAAVPVKKTKIDHIEWRSARPAAKALLPSPIPTLAPPVDATDKPNIAPLQIASDLADAGRFKEASAMCEEHLRTEGSSAAVYYLLGLICGAEGDERLAAEFYRKALYLEPTHSEAALHLALLLERQGDVTGARRLQGRARRLEEGARQ
jgi:chemotaxis protein methyltransferase WspC